MYHMRHEQSGVYMADGWARATGKPGVCFGTAGPGFGKFILAPQPDPASGLSSAAGCYDSPHGRIVSDWNIAAGRFVLKATIPPNTTAGVYVPARSPEAVTEGAKAAADRSG